MWRELVGAWWAAHRDAPVRVADLAKLCATGDLLEPVLGDGSGEVAARSPGPGPPARPQARLRRAPDRGRDRRAHQAPGIPAGQGREGGAVTAATAPGFAACRDHMPQRCRRANPLESGRLRHTRHVAAYLLPGPGPELFFREGRAERRNEEGGVSQFPARRCPICRNGEKAESNPADGLRHVLRHLCGMCGMSPAEMEELMRSHDDPRLDAWLGFRDFFTEHLLRHRLADTVPRRLRREHILAWRLGDHLDHVRLLSWLRPDRERRGAPQVTRVSVNHLALHPSAETLRCASRARAVRAARPSCTSSGRRSMPSSLSSRAGCPCSCAESSTRPRPVWRGEVRGSPRIDSRCIEWMA
jgi:hypothetical protein